jgi:hypothetical protein
MVDDPKPVEGEQQAEPQDAHAQKQERSVTGDVQVCGEVFVQLPPEIALRKDAADEERNAREKKKYGLEKATLIILTLYAGLTAIQSCQSIRSANAAKDAADAANRAATTASESLEYSSGQFDRTMNQMIDQTVIQSNSAIATQQAAGAAVSAANTSKEALHISQRAYLVLDNPEFDTAYKAVTISIQNEGHLSSGAVEIISHEATIEVPKFRDDSVYYRDVVEKHWKKTKLISVNITIPMTLSVLTPNVDSARLSSGHQTVIVVGTISYNDGFPDTPKRVEMFCLQSSYQTVLNKSGFMQCDASKYLPEIVKLDGYPLNEQQGTY